MLVPVSKRSWVRDVTVEHVFDVCVYKVVERPGQDLHVIMNTPEFHFTSAAKNTGMNKRL